MISVVLPERYPRAIYGARIILEHILGADLRFYTSDEGLAPINPTIYYGVTGDKISVPMHPLVRETGSADRRLELTADVPLPVFTSVAAAGDIPYDPFAAAFYLCSEYEQYSNTETDVHGRYDETRVAPFRWGIQRQPVLHRYAAELQRLLSSAYPALELRLPPASSEITVDLDQPWRYAHKPFYVQLGSAVKSAFRGHLKSFLEGVEVILGMVDPYENYEEILGRLSPSNTTFFVLSGGNAPQDNRFDVQKGALNRLVRHLDTKGYRIGLHPSYRAADQYELLSEQRKALESVVGDLSAVRNHYARYRLPDSRLWFIRQGFTDDYTTIPTAFAGFKYGCAVPFPFYDLPSETTTGLMLHPTLVMERTLSKYMNKTPEEAISETEAIVRQIEKWGGVFTLLIHNQIFSGHGENARWKPYIDHVLQRTASLNASP